MPQRPIEEVLAQHTDSLMAVPGVVGTGIGLCEAEPCIKVFVTDTTPEVKRRVPARLEGHPVRIEVTGPFRPLRPDTT